MTPSDDDPGTALVRQAPDRGINARHRRSLWQGNNEELVGRALKGRRRASSGNQIRPGRRDGRIVDGRPEYVVSACEASLKRLGVEVIDLYYQHRVDPAMPIEDTVGAMSRLVEQGKVRLLGLTEARPETIRRANGVHPIAAVQTEYSLLYRTRPRRRCKPRANSALRSWLIRPARPRPADRQGRSTRATLAETDTRRRHPRFAAENLAHNVALVHRIDESPAGKDARSGSSRSPGCSPRVRTSSRFPAPSERNNSRKISARFDRVHRRRCCPDFARHPGRRCRRHALSRSADEERVSLKRRENSTISALSVAVLGEPPALDRRSKPDRRSLFDRRSPCSRFSSPDRESTPLRRSFSARLSKPDRRLSSAIAVPPVAIFVFALRKWFIKLHYSFHTRPDHRDGRDASLSAMPEVCLFPPDTDQMADRSAPRMSAVTRNCMHCTIVSA